MAWSVGGEGRVTVVRLLHRWPDRYGVVGYTTSGRYGETALVGDVPVPGVPGLSLMDVAARHRPDLMYGSTGTEGFAEACWLISVGWSARTVPKPGTLELPHAVWTLDVDRTVDLGVVMYGHTRLHVGRLTLTDPDQMTRARALARPQ
ncbi:hypothetical protein [Streptomyces sp. NBC_00872]|uniref:hypothetical protein n=1 Tax=Streptomyces sp. NBC_00872 TaxID=2903686 RepID=UPI00386628BD|nr:hypothetical protein OG214_19020 [Streptomyces sp. NBC_00872]